MITMNDISYVGGRSTKYIYKRGDGVDPAHFFEVLTDHQGNYTVILTTQYAGIDKIISFNADMDCNRYIIGLQCHNIVEMTSNFLREMIFAMRRLEQNDRPPNPNTVAGAFARWHDSPDDGWELYDNFMKWYWMPGFKPSTWAHQGSPMLMRVL